MTYITWKHSVKRSSSLGSNMDNRVVGRNSGLILVIKDHPVCPKPPTCSSLNVLWMCCEAYVLGYGTYQAWSVSSSRSWATILTQRSLICSFMCCLKWDSNPYLQYKRNVLLTYSLYKVQSQSTSIHTLHLPAIQPGPHVGGATVPFPVWRTTNWSLWVAKQSQWTHSFILKKAFPSQRLCISHN